MNVRYSRHFGRQPQWLRRVLMAGAIALLAGSSIATPSTQPARGQRAAVVPIRGVIDDIQRDSLARRIAAARDAGATLLIFELDTPGGLVTSALDICRMIKGQPADVRTVAWVNPQAYSAGAMISVACNEIWMSPSSSLGDCAPIMVAPTGGVQELGEAERAKAESPILQEFRDSAARNGYDPLLSRAMVAVGDEVWWLERADDPTVRRFVGPEEKKRLIDDPPAGERAWQLVESFTTPNGKVITVMQPVDRANELLTMSQYDAVAYGFARGIVASADELAAQLGAVGPLTVHELTGWEKFAAWLNSPVVRGILLALVMLGAYIEFQSPGLILPGAVALLALAVFLAAPYAAGLADVWTLILFALGLILLAVEIFVLPGFGIAGILGIALIIVAILGSFVPSEPEVPSFSLPTLRGTWTGLVTGLKVLLGSTVASVIGVFLLAKYLPKTRVAVGVVSDNPRAETLAPDAGPVGAQVGDVGVVTGALRPGGQARFGSEIVDVQSQGEYVEAGRRVRVIRRLGMSIIVRPLTDEETA